MSELKATPGPWAVQDPLGPEILSIVHGGPESYQWRHIAGIPADGDEIPAHEAKANAHLIAAAPELYEALHRAFKELMWAYDNMDAACLKFAADQAREALAKARGESS